MAIDEFLEQGKPKNLALKHVRLSRNSYYYSSAGTGTKPDKRHLDLYTTLRIISMT